MMVDGPVEDHIHQIAGLGPESKELLVTTRQFFHISN
jgi:hypothetical protein